MPTSEIYSQMTTEDLLAIRQGRYQDISTPGLQFLRTEAGGSQFGRDADAGKIGTPESPLPYKGAPDLPLETPWADPADLLPLGAGAKIGAKAGSALLGGPLRGLARFRLGSDPGRGYQKVAEAVTDTAPAAVQPIVESAEGLSHTMRSGAGKTALGQSRDRQLTPIQTDLASQTAASRVAAAAGMTGPQAASAAAAVPDKAAHFMSLLDELAAAGRGGHNPATGQARTGVSALGANRSKQEILQEIRSTLTPQQWAAFEAAQREYGQGAALLRLFRPKEGGTDVLTSQAALQNRAKTMQATLDPKVTKAIFRGGNYLETDKPASIPIGLSKFGSIKIPGTVMAGPPGSFQQLIAKLFGGLMGGAGAYGLGKGLED